MTGLLAKIPGLRQARDRIAFVAGWWFDWRRNVRTLPLIAPSIWASVGFGVRLSSAVADKTCPA